MRVRFVIKADCLHAKSTCKPDWSSLAVCVSSGFGYSSRAHVVTTSNGNVRPALGVVVP